MKTIKLIAALAIFWGLSACTNSSKDNSSILIDSIEPVLQGIWLAEDKGLVLKVGADSVLSYVFTSDYCFLKSHDTDVSTDDLMRNFRQNNQNQLRWFAGYGSHSLSASGFILDKVSSLPNQCLNSVVALQGQQGHVRNPEQTFSIFTQIFEEYYVSFDLKDVDWMGNAQEKAAGISSSSSDLDLLIAMDEMIEPLADGHTSIKTPSGIVVGYNNKPTLTDRLVAEFAQANNLPYPITPDSVNEEQITALTNYVETNLALQKEIVLDYAEESSNIKYRADESVFWFTNENIGYLHIGKMQGFHQYDEDADALENDTAEIAAIDAIMDEALADLANVNGLIIDVRTNNGGYEYVSLAIANRFTDMKTLAYTKKHGKNSPIEELYLEPRGDNRYTGPIALLVSNSSASAAETFAMSMATLDNVTLVGESTQGIFSDVMTWELPNGFEIGLSNEFYFDVNNEWLEGKGVPVDVETPFFTMQERGLEVDAGLEAAFELLNL